MPITLQIVREIALALPGVEEGKYFDTPAFYVRRKMMLRLREDGETLVVAFAKEQRKTLIERRPDVFSLTEHYRNYDCVLLNLLTADAATLGEMIEGAWRLKATKTQVSLYDANRSPQRSPGEGCDASAQGSWSPARESRTPRRRK